MQLICQLRPSYDHETNETPPRYEKNCSRYEARLTPLSERLTRPPKIPATTPRRNPPTSSRPRDLPPWESLFPIRASYASGNNGNTLRYEKYRFRYESIPIPYLAPICDGTVPHPNSRPIRPNHHYETRTTYQLNRIEPINALEGGQQTLGTRSSDLKYRRPAERAFNKQTELRKAPEWQTEPDYETLDLIQ